MVKAFNPTGGKRALEMFKAVNAAGEQLGVSRQLIEDDHFEGDTIILGGQRVANFGLCSYLGLGTDERLIEGAIDAVRRFGTSYSSSIAYTALGLYGDLTERLERMLGARVILAGTTTLGHFAALPVLVGSGDTVFFDGQAHASLLSVRPSLTANGADVEMIPHNDMAILEERLAAVPSDRSVWFLTDGVFSMHGDTVPVEEVHALLDRYPNFHIYCDDAHGFGWDGPRGSGTYLKRAGWHDRLIISLGMAKSFGTMGGIVATTNEEFFEMITLTGAPLIFGGPLPPPILGASVASADLHLSGDLQGLQDDLNGRIRFVNEFSQEIGLPLAGRHQTPLWFLEVVAVGDDTALAGIQRLVAQAQSSRSRAQVLADRAAALLFYVAVGAAVVTFSVWAALSQPDEAVVRTVAVLVIACPHALGLAIPLVVSISTDKAARNGILVKDRLALEGMRTVDVVLFDKTGTLTKGNHRLTGIAAVDGDTTSLIALAAAAESDSEHPLARAIVKAAEEDGVDRPEVSGFRSMSGRGVEAEIGGSIVGVGGPTYIKDRGLAVTNELESDIASWQQRGASILYVTRDSKVIGALSLEDETRPESRDAVDRLHRLGVRVALITGDALQVAKAVAADLGIDEVYAEVLPEDKHSKVAQLQQRGFTVAMVGDGVNDAPALAQADVGIAIGAGTDVAVESAGIVLASDDPLGVVAVRRLSEAGHRKMLQNLSWAAGYNVLAIPLAAGVLAWAGIVLGPAVAALLMSASTVIVAINAQFLRGLDLKAGA